MNVFFDIAVATFALGRTVDDISFDGSWKRWSAVELVTVVVRVVVGCSSVRLVMAFSFNMSLEDGVGHDVAVGRVTTRFFRRCLVIARRNVHVRWCDGLYNLVDSR